MGFWTEIKHAINSTLGTSEFKPLDKLFLEQKALVASDVPFYEIVAGEKRVDVGKGDNTATLPYKIKMLNAGSLRVSVMLKRSNSSNYTTLRIYVNDVERAKLQSSLNNADYFLETADINFKQDDVISFSASGYTYAFIKDLTLCGTIVDNSLFKDITN